LVPEKCRNLVYISVCVIVPSKSNKARFKIPSGR
jgi:hypothetical protein